MVWSPGYIGSTWLPPALKGWGYLPLGHRTGSSVCTCHVTPFQTDDPLIDARQSALFLNHLKMMKHLVGLCKELTPVHLRGFDGDQGNSLTKEPRYCSSSV